MVTRYHYRDLVWIDLESPTQDEVRGIMQEFDINPLAADELLIPTLRPKVDVFRDFLFVILHFPVSKHTHSGNSLTQEVDFIIGKKYLITTRYETIDPLHKFSKVFEVNSILDRSDIGDHAGYLFFYMLKKLYASVNHELDFIGDQMGAVEEKIFEGYEKEMVVSISDISRQLISFRQASLPHGEILNSLESAVRHFFSHEFVYHIKSVVGKQYRLQTEIDTMLDELMEIRETNNSLITTKQNEIMKVLTIMAFVTFPLSLVAGIFGMNTINSPIVGHPFDFWILIGGMGFTAALFFIYFKYKKWL